MNPTRNRSSIIYLLLFVAIISMVVINFTQGSADNQALTINEVAAMIQAGDVKTITESDNSLTVVDSDGNPLKSHKESSSTLVDQLKALGVTTERLQPEKIKIEIEPPER